MKLKLSILQVTLIQVMLLTSIAVIFLVPTFREFIYYGDEKLAALISAGFMLGSYVVISFGRKHTNKASWGLLGVLIAWGVMLLIFFGIDGIDNIITTFTKNDYVSSSVLIEIVTVFSFWIYTFFYLLELVNTLNVTQFFHAKSHHTKRGMIIISVIFLLVGSLFLTWGETINSFSIVIFDCKSPRYSRYWFI